MRVENRDSLGISPYSEDVYRALNQILKDHSIEEVLEIGPGWGNYSFRLAEDIERLSLLDQSKDILDYLALELENKSLKAEEFINQDISKWEPKRSYESIFAFNSLYRVYNIKEVLEKIHRYSEKLAIIGMTIGPKQEYFQDLEEELGLELNYKKSDYIYLLNILYSMGICPNVKVIDLVRDMEFKNKKEVFKHLKSRIKTEEYSQEEVEAIGLRYYRYEAEIYRYRHKFKAVIIYW